MLPKPFVLLASWQGITSHLPESIVLSKLRKRNFLNGELPLHIKTTLILVWFSSYLCNENIDMFKNRYPLIFLAIFSSFAASYGIVLLSKVIDKMLWLGSSLRYIGQRTLCILCVHEIGRYCFKWEWDYPQNYWLICAVFVSLIRIVVELVGALLISNLITVLKKGVFNIEF